MSSTCRARSADEGGPQTTIATLLEAQTTARAQAPALLAPDREPLDYGALWAHVGELAHGLRMAGVQAQDRVAIVLPNGPEMAIAFLAVAACATSAPLNPAYRTDELGWYLSDMDAKAIVVGAEADLPAITVARERGIPVLALAADGAQAGACRLLDSPRDARSADDGAVASLSSSAGTALVLHTSGTTGRPKIVGLTQGQLCASARNTATTLRLSEGDRCLNVLPLFHIHGLVAALLGSLSAGGSVVCAPGCLAPWFFDWIDELSPTWYTAVPTMHRAIAARAPQYPTTLRSHRLRFVRSSSSALPAPLLAELESLWRVPVIEAYGMTEACHQIASNPLPPGERRAGSVGVAAGPELMIVRDGRPAGPGVDGEVVIRGQTVTRGYEDLDLTAAGFSKGWFRTGDQGHLDRDGYLFLTGRLKEVINRGGETIAPREIDEALMEHPAVSEAVAFAVADPRLGEDVAAAVVLRSGSSTSLEEIRGFAAARLSGSKVPRRLVSVDAIPASATGKPRRIGLAAALGLEKPEASPANGAARAGSRTPLEARLAGIWAEVLDTEQVAIDDHFLDLGGDSLLAMRLVGAIVEELGLELSPRALFDAPTVAEQATVVEEWQRGAGLG